MALLLASVLPACSPAATSATSEPAVALRTGGGLAELLAPRADMVTVIDIAAIYEANMQDALQVVSKASYFMNPEAIHRSCGFELAREADRMWISSGPSGWLIAATFPELPDRRLRACAETLFHKPEPEPDPEPEEECTVRIEIDLGIHFAVSPGPGNKGSIIQVFEEGTLERMRQERAQHSSALPEVLRSLPADERLWVKSASAHNQEQHDDDLQDWSIFTMSMGPRKGRAVMQATGMARESRGKPGRFYGPSSLKHHLQSFMGRLKPGIEGIEQAGALRASLKALAIDEKQREVHIEIDAGPMTIQQPLWQQAAGRSYAHSAQQTLSIIAQAVQKRYARERLDSREETFPISELCGSGVSPVPASIPRGMLTRPAPDAFKRGGWACIGFSTNSSVRYQFGYRTGSGYKGPARGGPDPGPEGFEVTAEGDLDGDGMTSLFTITGRIDPDGDDLVLAPLFVVDELE